MNLGLNSSLAYNVNMVNQQPNSKTGREHSYLWLVVGFVLFAGILVIISGYYTSKYLLRKAENEANTTNKLTFLLASNALWPEDSVQMQIADAYFNGKDYTKAANCYGQVFSQQGITGFAKAKYSGGAYQSVLSLERKQASLLSPETKFVIAQSYMKVGNILKTREVLITLSQTTDVIESRLMLLDPVQSQKYSDNELSRLAAETNAENRRLLAYNVLNKRGFPQAAFSLLKEGYTKNELSRDGLLTLAQAQIEKNQDSDAFATLEDALAKDGYYPQTYRQLIKIGGKLGKETASYQSRLSAITW